MDVPRFIHPFIRWCILSTLGSFYFLAIMKNAAMNIPVHVCVSTHFVHYDEDMSLILESRNLSSFSFLD